MQQGQSSKAHPFSVLGDFPTEDRSLAVKVAADSDATWYG